MNKTDLINKLAERLDGDKKSAQTAIEGVIDLIQREVHSGGSVSISGFGVFEKRARAARTARNPRTGDAVKVKKTTIPAFRPGKYFKDVISGTVKLPKATGAVTSARAAAAAAKASTTAKPTRATAAKAAPAKATATRAT
ncbi:HU family DNA-binding protein, partial [Nakamurella silvestris]